MLLANRTPAKAEKLAGELGCACGTNEQVAGICDFIFLGVKPQMIADMLDELSATLESRAETALCAGHDGGRSLDAADPYDGGQRLSNHPHDAQHPRGAGRWHDPVLLR